MKSLKSMWGKRFGAICWSSVLLGNSWWNFVAFGLSFKHSEISMCYKNKWNIEFSSF